MALLKTWHILTTSYALQHNITHQVRWWAVPIQGPSTPVVSPFSTVTSFDMALLNVSDWKGAQWVGGFNQIRTGTSFNCCSVLMVLWWCVMFGCWYVCTSLPVTFLYSEFSVNSPISRARAYICGLGYHELYINGKKVGKPQAAIFLLEMRCPMTHRLETTDWTLVGPLTTFGNS